MTLDDYETKFEQQFAGTAYYTVGGFYNPQIDYEDAREVAFFCHYDGYSDRDDGWEWYYNKETGMFHN